MAFHLKDDFRAGGPVSQVPATWFNSVSKFLNNLVGGFGIRVHKDKPDRPVIEMDPEKIKDLVLTTTPPVVGEVSDAQRAAFAPKEVEPFKPAADETTAEKLARVGSSTIAAPYDHKHRLGPPEEPTVFVNPQPTSGVSSTGSTAYDTAFFEALGNGDGLQLMVATRIDVVSGSIGVLFFRQVTVTPDGRVYSVGPEVEGVEVVMP